MIRNSLLVFGLIICYCNIIDGLTTVTRSEWGAKAASRPYKNINGAAPYVVIHHSASPSCNSLSSCSSRIQNFQKEHMAKEWRDIGYNFLISDEGKVYEGQGWGKAGTHAGNLNHKSVGICMIGTFTTSPPTDKALTALKELIASGVSNGKISSNYKLVGHKQVKATECPGTSLYNLLKTWPNYSARI